MELFVIAAWVVLCFVVSAAAGARGRSGGAFFVLSFFLSPLIGLLVLIALPNLKSARLQMQQVKQNEALYELMATQPEQRAALVQRRAVEREAEDHQRDVQENIRRLVILAIVVAVVVILYHVK